MRAYQEGINLGADDQDTKKVRPQFSLCILSALMCMHSVCAHVHVSREGIDLAAEDQDTKMVRPLSSPCFLSAHGHLF